MNTIKKTNRMRLLSMILMLCMVISLLPMTAFADGPTEITAVDVSDIALPEAGATPDYDVTLPAGANYHLGTAEELRNLGWTDLDVKGLTNGMRWDTAGYSLLSSPDRFEADKKYYFTVALLPNSGYTFSDNPNATLNGSADILQSTYIYRGALLVFSTDLKATGAGGGMTTPVTMEIPLSKQVFSNGKHAPGLKTFEFEVEPYGNPQADISSLTITGATIATDGPGTYPGTLKIVGDPDVIDNARGLKITEKNDGAAYWGYDELPCIVYRNTGNGMLIQKDRGTTTLETVQTAVFYNSYRNNTMTVEIPFSKTVSQTGSTAPGANTFEFEVKPYGNSNVDMSAFTITGTTIDTDGAGNYTGTIKIVGDAKTIDDAKGFTITEKNTGAANWTYDDTVYIANVAFFWADNIPMNANIMFAKKTGTGPNAIPQEVQSIEFTNAYAYSAPVSTDVTIEILISETVKLGGNTAPGVKTFEFEVKPYGNSQADISSLTITGATIVTDGAGNYTGTLKIVGDPDVIDNARGLKITEKNDGAKNWSYDTATYIVYRDSGNGMIIQKDMGANMNPQPVQSAEFTSTYTKNSGTTKDPTNPGQDTNKDDSSHTTSPKTDDNSNMFLWIVLMVVSWGGIVAIGSVKKKKAHSK